MSGMVKSVGKIFKKVAKGIKKVAPYALAAAAIYFTAGAALGGTASFGSMSSTAMTNMFGEGILADTLAGAVTQAGYGSLIGGAISGVSGGDISEGMQKGALVGSLTGGATGFMQSPYDMSGSTPTTSATPPTVTGATPVPSPTAGAVIPTPGPTPTAVPGAVARPGLLGMWDEVKNSELAGGIAKGVGEALLTGDDDAYARAAAINAQSAEDARKAAWGGGGNAGLLTSADVLESPDRLTPGQKYDYTNAPPTGLAKGPL